MEWVTTTILLEQLADGDEQAWAQVAERFRLPVLGHLRRLGVPEDQVDDVAQEALVTFLDAYRRGRYDRDKGRLSSWLFALVAQAVARHRRSHARNREREAPAATVFWDDLPGEDEQRRLWDQQWEQHVLDHCMRQVRREFKAETVAAFEAQVLRGEKPAEVAAATGLSLSSVYVARHRVLKRIRLLRDEYEHGGR